MLPGFSLPQIINVALSLWSIELRVSTTVILIGTQCSKLQTYVRSELNDLISPCEGIHFQYN